MEIKLVNINVFKEMLQNIEKAVLIDAFLKIE